jgi:malate dehydrogenase (oxaloacetate-decarboxylating)(NADP+)
MTAEQTLKARALAYHADGFAGKIAITSKPVATADDLSLAYSPGVAEPCLVIAEQPESAYLYTAVPCWGWAILVHWPASP